MNRLLFSLLFFLPAGLANMAPVFASKIPGLKRWQTPLDFKKTYRSKRVFDTNKTWRGLVSGIVLGAVTGLLVFPHLSFGLQRGNFYLLGSALGAGALLGDAIESFFKRQVGVPAGHSWFPFDQLDYILGGLLLSLIFVRLPLTDYLLIVILYFGLHLTTSYLGYLVHLKEKPL